MFIVNLTEEHMHYVVNCTHIDDIDEEREKVLWVRESWLRNMMNHGLIVKVALDKGKPVGFIHCMPIELGIRGMNGKELMAVPCLTLDYRMVYEQGTGSGYGRLMMHAVEEEARMSAKGVAVLAYDNDFWLMPRNFFAKLGYHEAVRKGNTVIMLKTFENVEPPILHTLNFKPKQIPGKVVFDAFWDPMCLTSIVEIQRVREICEEYGDDVILNEYNCGNKVIRERYQVSRGLFINGEPKSWGYEAPRDGLRTAIEKVLPVN